MNKEIVVDVFNISSIKSAIKRIDDIQKDITSKTDKILQRLAEIGAETAKSYYAAGVADDNDSVEVTITPISNGYMLTASGEDVYFLEFGTGTAAGAGYDTSVIIPPVDISSGSWSRTEGTGEFEKYGSWHHNGQKYTMTIPRMGMYHAVKEIESRMDEVAREVFNE